MDDLIQKLEEFQEIKAPKEWVDILFLKITSLKEKPKVTPPPIKAKTISFNFLNPKYRFAFASLIVFLVFSSVLVYAQNTLPGNPLYPFKTLTQDIQISLAPKNQKPIVKLEVAKARLNDLLKINSSLGKENITQKLKEEITLIPEEVKNLEKKKVVLDVSLKVKEKNTELKNIIEKSPLKEDIKKDLNLALKDSENKVLAIINETSEIINNCPSYLEEKLNYLKDYFFDNNNLVSWTPEKIIKAKALLIEIEKSMKIGNCLEAIEKIESIEKL